MFEFPKWTIIERDGIAFTKSYEEAFASIPVPMAFKKASFAVHRRRNSWFCISPEGRLESALSSFGWKNMVWKNRFMKFFNVTSNRRVADGKHDKVIAVWEIEKRRICYTGLSGCIVRDGEVLWVLMINMFPKKKPGCCAAFLIRFQNEKKTAAFCAAAAAWKAAVRQLRCHGSVGNRSEQP